MGNRGPVPNRSTDLSRDRDANRDQSVLGRVSLTKGKSRPVTKIPEPDPGWHPIATLIYTSALASGQSDFYEASDYAVLWSICEDLSYYKRMGRRSGQMMAAIYSAMTSLNLTEGDRRRVRIELEGEPEVDDAVEVAMGDYKRQLGVS